MGSTRCAQCPPVSCLGTRLCLLCDNRVGATVWGAAAKGTTFERAGWAHKHSSLGTPLRRHAKSGLGQEECSRGIFVPPVVFVPGPGLHLWTEATLGCPGRSSHLSRLSSASMITTFHHTLQYPLFLFLWAFLPLYRKCGLDRWRSSCYLFW